MKNTKIGLLMVSLVVIGCMQPVYAQRLTPAQQRAAAQAAAAKEAAEKRAAEDKAKADAEAAAKATAEREAAEKKEAERKAAQEQREREKAIADMNGQTWQQFKSYLDTAYTSLDRTLAENPTMGTGGQAPLAKTRKDIADQVLDTTGKMANSSSVNNQEKKRLNEAFTYFVREWEKQAATPGRGRGNRP